MDPVVTVRQGTLRGSSKDGVSAFLGIPYAAPPVGPARFELPIPAAGWDGVRDALAFGPTPPKPVLPASPISDLLPDPEIPGDDCLNLNVWTPEPGGSGLPVMVWIHGGAFRTGSSVVAWYDGAPFARDGVVLVSINYRLGVAGFGVLADAPANLGLRDQLQALAWVQENIAAFGGDPGNVTIFGESAGGMSVNSLVSAKASEGLFRRAIAQSGAGQIGATLEDGAKIAAELAGKLGVEPTAKALAQVPTEKLFEAQQAVALELAADPNPERYGKSIVASSMPFVPTIDGDLLSARPVDAIAAGAGQDVDYLAGTTTEEMRFFLVPTGILPAITPDAIVGYLTNGGWDPLIGQTYFANRPDASSGDVLSAIMTDTYFRVPTIRVAEARAALGQTSYMYEFAWRSPVQELGACHAIELAFVFDNLDTPRLAAKDSLTGPNPPQAVADKMHAAWVAFAKTGNPGWPAYSPDQRSVMSFNDPAVEVVDDPRGDERAAWDGLI
jgi:para-nitrobenzyl esterase